MKIFALSAVMFLSAVGTVIYFSYSTPKPSQISQIHLALPVPVTLQTPKAPEKSLDSMIHSAARRHNISASLIRGIIKAESSFNPKAVSNKGAIGLMQLMPTTAADFGMDPKVPEENIEAGSHLLKNLLKRYSTYKNGTARAIAAYNAGPGNVDKYSKKKYNGIPPFKETRNYVSRVMKYMKEFEKDLG